mmetsp:Transcript_57289/g.140528  ORF Transcript_57289/g.140528 Transcript_57289/m.140528 type:complete len:291 (+) Transcript_57289:170-1042(+)
MRCARASEEAFSYHCAKQRATRTLRQRRMMRSATTRRRASSATLAFQRSNALDTPRESHLFMMSAARSHASRCASVCARHLLSALATVICIQRERILRALNMASFWSAACARHVCSARTSPCCVHRARILALSSRRAYTLSLQPANALLTLASIQRRTAAAIVMCARSRAAYRSSMKSCQRSHARTTPAWVQRRRILALTSRCSHVLCCQPSKALLTVAFIHLLSANLMAILPLSRASARSSVTCCHLEKARLTSPSIHLRTIRPAVVFMSCLRRASTCHELKACARRAA